MRDVSTDPFYAALAAAVADECGAPASSISPQGSAADVPGWDSLGHTRIIMNLEARLERTVDMRATYMTADFEELRALFMA